MGKIYTFLSPNQNMQQGDETIDPWGHWRPIAPKHYGRPVSEKKAASVRRPIPELLKALKEALEDLDDGDIVLAATRIAKTIAKAEGK